MSRGRMSQGRTAPPPLEGEPVFRVVEKMRAAAARLGSLKRAAHEAQVREALTRAELSAALNESLAARAGLEARLRAEALAAHVRRTPPSRPRRHGRPSRTLEKLLARLGSLGQAAVIARSGVWRGTGRPAFDLRHMAAYARRGANPAVAPEAFFDQAWYLAANPDVAAAGGAPLVHYLVSGGFEDRSPHPLFDAAWYRRENAADLAASGLTPLEHYVRTGAARGLSPHPLFDVGHYLAQGPALAPGEGPAEHYLREGWGQGLSPHPLFDPAWYAHHAGPGAEGGPFLTHYLTRGWREGVSPHPLFDVAWYLERNPDVAALDIDPLTHFLAEGAAEGRSPGPWFDVPHYLEARGEALAPGTNPVLDYLQGGAWAIAEPRPGFPSAAYIASRPDLVRDGLTPLEHWARRRGR